jgi:hypothetical protein
MLATQNFKLDLLTPVVKPAVVGDSKRGVGRGGVEGVASAAAHSQQS